MSKVSIKDIEFVCNTIDVYLFPDEMDDVLNRYENWEESDKDENWLLVVENFIYQILLEKQRL